MISTETFQTTRLHRESYKYKYQLWFGPADAFLNRYFSADHELATIILHLPVSQILEASLTVRSSLEIENEASNASTRHRVAQ